MVVLDIPTIELTLTHWLGICFLSHIPCIKKAQSASCSYTRLPTRLRMQVTFPAGRDAVREPSEDCMVPVAKVELGGDLLDFQ